MTLEVEEEEEEEEEEEDESGWCVVAKQRSSRASRSAP